ncbi:MAG: hypothetical protein NUV72_10230 [Bauldia sp.]|nr:hypothetical protein [Bauldia sp.]
MPFLALSWGLIAGSAVFVGAALGWYARLPPRLIAALVVDTMIPEAFSETHEAAGLIAALGFLAGFALSFGLG